MTLKDLPARITPDDLLDLEDDGLFELVAGKLVEKKPGTLANRTIPHVAYRLGDFLRQNQLGFLMIRQTFQCFPDDRERIRRPDLSFIGTERAADVPDEGHIRIAPDLLVEVTSPNDKIYEFEEKLVDYRSAGIKLVWEVNPRFRSVRVHRLDRPAEKLNETDTLTAEPVLPGFSVQVKDLLPPPAK